MSFARAELVRLLLIHREILQQRYPTHARLAELAGVSVQTIKRDMELLRKEFDAPWAYDYQQRGFYYRHAFALLPESFGNQEAMALCLTLEVADSFRNTPFAPALKRMRALTVPPETFLPPDPQHLRTRLAARFTNEAPLTPDTPVEVKIYFDPVGARWIREREWHASQQREDHPDGSCTLTMTVAGLAGVRRWILGFGTDVERVLTEPVYPSHFFVNSMAPKTLPSVSVK